MSGPYAEGGPLPPADPEVLGRHERRIAAWEDEIAARITQAGAQRAGDEEMPSDAGEQE